MRLVSRRAFLRTASASGLAVGVALAGLAASSPALSQQSTAPKPAAADDWQTSWADLIAAAQAEGALSLVTVAGAGYRALIAQFQQEFPAIAVSHLPESSERLWFDAVRSGLQAGAAGFDLAIVQPGETVRRGRNEGLWSPLRPLLMRPDVTGHDLWRNGFDGQFMDTERGLFFGWEHQVFHAYAVDSSVVGEGEIQTAKDLLHPKWRGRILSLDPRSGTGLLSAASVARASGMDVVRQLLVDQQPTFVQTGPREVTESLARGRFAIALGVRPKALKHLQDQGIGQKIQYLDLPDADFVQPMVLAHVVNAPHPAAAQLFANWMLTQAAQMTLTGGLQTDSARTDIPAHTQAGVGTPGVVYFHPDRDEHVQLLAETRRLVQQLLA